jgi:hypothetical protein
MLVARTSAAKPDPLLLAFYLNAQSHLIVQLIILRNRSAI